MFKRMGMGMGSNGLKSDNKNSHPIGGGLEYGQDHGGYSHNHNSQANSPGHAGLSPIHADGGEKLIKETILMIGISFAVFTMLVVGITSLMSNIATASDSEQKDNVFVAASNPSEGGIMLYELDNNGTLTITDINDQGQVEVSQEAFVKVDKLPSETISSKNAGKDEDGNDLLQLAQNPKTVADDTPTKIVATNNVKNPAETVAVAQTQTTTKPETPKASSEINLTALAEIEAEKLSSTTAISTNDAVPKPLPAATPDVQNPAPVAAELALATNQTIAEADAGEDAVKASTSIAPPRIDTDDGAVVADAPTTEPTPTQLPAETATTTPAATPNVALGAADVELNSAGSPIYVTPEQELFLGKYAVQFMSLSKEEDALEQVRVMAKVVPTAYMVRADLGVKGVFYRIRAFPTNDRAAATSYVRALKERNFDVYIVSIQ